MVNRVLPRCRGVCPFSTRKQPRLVCIASTQPAHRKPARESVGAAFTPSRSTPCQDSFMCLQRRHGIHLPSAQLPSGRGGLLSPCPLSCRSGSGRRCTGRHSGDRAPLDGATAQNGFRNPTDWRFSSRSPPTGRLLVLVPVVHDMKATAHHAPIIAIPPSDHSPGFCRRVRVADGVRR